MNTSIMNTSTKSEFVEYSISLSETKSHFSKMTSSFHNPKQITCVEIYKKYGIQRKNIHHMLINLFHFPQEYMDFLSDYYLKYWEGKYFESQLKDGTITDNDKEYMVVYKDCTPYQVKRSGQVKLSFRNPHKELNIPAYVLVKLA